MTETPDEELHDDTEDEEQPESISPGDPEWLTFEKDVKELLASKDPSATVEHNHKREGKSGRIRQIDALVTGTVCDEVIEIGVEAKRYGKKVGIGVIDAFVGKCLDTGVDRGVLYSHKGFGKGAIARANAADHPKIMLRTLPDETSADPDLRVELVPWRDILPDFLEFKPCPGDECYGEVMVRSDFSWDGGLCDQCGMPSGECRQCGEFQRLELDDQHCYSCDFGGFEVGRERDTGDVNDIQWVFIGWDHPELSKQLRGQHG